MAISYCDEHTYYSHLLFDCKGFGSKLFVWEPSNKDIENLKMNTSFNLLSEIIKINA